jgi:hypothetical protein
METGDPEAIIPGFCELTHLKAWAAMGERSGHRRDATCCLGEGRLAAHPEDQAEARLGGGCGSCGHADSEPKDRLVRLERRRTGSPRD